MPGSWSPNLSWVAPGLAVGGSFPRGAAAALAREHAVGFVIDLRGEACDDEAELAACGLQFLHLPTVDHHAVAQEALDAGCAFAARAQAQEKRLLVHCEHGIGRSALLALCIMVERGADPLEALRQAKDARALVSPSPAQYEAWAEWLRRRAPHAAVPRFDAFKAIAYRHLAAQA